MSLFDTHVVVDWSAAGRPVTGSDSLWIAILRDGALRLINPATRAEGMGVLRDLLDAETAAGRRALVGFDFPFGYPRGLSQAIRPGGDWRDVWAQIAALVEDAPDNANNRFDAAAQLNTLFAGDGPFWGNGLPNRDIDGLPRKKPQGWGDTLPDNMRTADSGAQGAQEVWKLSGAGSVGGQALTGIAALEQLRGREDVRIWPFEDHAAGHVLAEAFPSLLPITVPEGQVKDAVQVETLARALAACDAAGELAAMLAADLTTEQQSDAATILGLSHLDVLRGAAPDLSAKPAPGAPGRKMRPYEKDPSAIYAQSFATVRAEARLGRFPAELQPMVIRLIHACGMVEIADRLAFSPDAMAAGRAALAAGAPVICDCEMVGSGIIRRHLPETEILVTLNDARVPDMARDLGTTRSAAAVELWRDRIEGAVVAVGNAPTALFHLLEKLDEGWPKPALILGFPVGFVGAAESKAELSANPRGCEFVALKGRRGGSAMAAAAVNALANGISEERA